MINKKIQNLSTIFSERLSIPLFDEIPISEISAVCTDLDGFESLRIKSVDLCNILDRINKKQLDKYSGIKSQGSKSCLMNALKKYFANNHDEINSIEMQLDFIFLIRDFLTHKKNKNISKAWEYLEINIDNDSPGIVWKKIKNLFDNILDTIISLFYKKSDLIKQDEIDKKVKENILNMFGEKYCKLLDKPRGKAFLAYILSNDKVVDTEMAEIFNLEIDELRKELLAYIPIFLKISYCTRTSTYISIKDNWKEYISNYFAGGIKYEN